MTPNKIVSFWPWCMSRDFSWVIAIFNIFLAFLDFWNWISLTGHIFSTHKVHLLSYSRISLTTKSWLCFTPVTTRTRRRRTTTTTWTTAITTIAKSQLLRTEFWPDYKGRFLGSTTTITTTITTTPTILSQPQLNHNSTQPNIRDGAYVIWHHKWSL